MAQINIYEAAELLDVSGNMLARLRIHIPGFPQPVDKIKQAMMYDSDEILKFGQENNVWKIMKDIERKKKKPEAVRKNTAQFKPVKPKLANVAKLF